jgi:murein DD-endopeptidase MepM/ murein hydrolase activator NlpD
MQARLSWSELGRCALTSMAASTLIFLGGCSSGTSRFDFPAFNLARNTDAPLADPNSTASLPVPQESVYAPAGSGSGNQSAQLTPLPPPQSYPTQPYTPRVTPAAYSPTPSFRPQAPAYPPSVAPRVKPLMLQTNAEPALTRNVTVAPGDNLYTLSKRYGVPTEAIQSANHLTDTHLHLGQRLVIPGAGPAATAQASGPGKNPAAATAVAANAGKPVRGAAAPASAPDVHVVKTTAIPAAGSEPHVSAPATGPAKPAPVVADTDITGPTQAQNAKVASVDQLPAPEPMSGNSFRWPVQGRIVSEFGTKPDGGHNDGIDVAVPQGTSVKAAENGVVAYAGDELKGYGNLVLIRHSNNWVSAYANNDEILVKRGDQVRRGQIIAKAGKTGQASQPQLHFELRKGSRPMDPTKYMANAQANAD